MLADQLTITYNAVAVTLNRATESNYSSSYFGESTGLKFTLDIKHTIPARGQAGESHLVKLTVEHFDGNGVYVRSVSPWMVIKTFDAVQDSTAATRAANALVGLMTSTFVSSIVGRQS